MDKLFAIIHHHRHGVDVHTFIAQEEPALDEAIIESLAIDYEPEREEWLEMQCQGPINAQPRTKDAQGVYADNESIIAVLDVSTRHITVNDAIKIGEIARNDIPAMPVIYPKAGYGWYIHVTEDMDMVKRLGEIMSKCFIAVYVKAIALNCTMICLDRDGHEYDDLQDGWED